MSEQRTKYDTKILGKGNQCRFNSDPFVSGLNNNELVVGGPGSGKTTSIVEPNLLHMRNGNAVVVLTKSGRSDIIKQGLREHGYRIFEINFAHPEKSTYGYDPLTYCRTDADIRALAHGVIHAADEKKSTGDPYWPDSAENILYMILWYVANGHFNRGRRMQDALYLLDHFTLNSDATSDLEDYGVDDDGNDRMEDLRAGYERYQQRSDEEKQLAEKAYRRNRNCWDCSQDTLAMTKEQQEQAEKAAKIRDEELAAAQYTDALEKRRLYPLHAEMRKMRRCNLDFYYQWKSFCDLPDNTASCVASSLKVPLSLVFNPEIREILKNTHQFDFAELLQPKTVLFVQVTPANVAHYRFISFFYTQLFQALFELAEKQHGYVLPYPVQIFADDFATGCPIPDFDAKISVMREKNIGVTLLIQSESQLDTLYGHDKAVTIINGCDTYLYFGGMDINTCHAMSQRMNLPYDEVQNMPIGQEFIIRRGQKPMITERYSVFEDPIYKDLVNQSAR